jgi:hypothetical protein
MIVVFLNIKYQYKVIHPPVCYPKEGMRVDFYQKGGWEWYSWTQSINEIKECVILEHKAQSSSISDAYAEQEVTLQNVYSQNIYSH